MTVKQENAEAMLYLSMECTSERSKAVLELAKAHGLENSTVMLPNGDVHAAAAFAQHLYCNANDIGKPSDAEQESYQIVSILLALEESRDSSWSYGSELLYSFIPKIKGNDPKQLRKEVAAFLAVEGTYSTNKSKGDLLDGNMMATSMYCARLRSLYNSLPGIGKGLVDYNSDAMRQLLEAKEDSAKATIEKLALMYIPALIGAENRKKVENFLSWLANRTDFYSAPASTKYHLSEPGGLAEHTVNVIYCTADLLLPASDAQIGEIVMAALCHDLCKVGVYVPTPKNKKVYSENGSKVDEIGRFDWIASTVYSYKDDLPFGHGRKSMYIALGFFGDSMPPSVASAIDAHMHDIDVNHNVGLQMMQQPLGLWLHIGDAIAAHIVEAGK